MARAGRLKKPILTAEAHRALNNAPHQLHVYAKYPTLTSMEDTLEGDRVPLASRATIHNAFSSTRLPRVGLVDALAVDLAARIRNVEPEMIDKVSVIFDNLWFLADIEDRQREDDQSEEMTQDVSWDAAPDSAARADAPELLPALARPASAAPMGTPLDLSVRLRLQPDQGRWRSAIHENRMLRDTDETTAT
ncbi:hypothetical protein [Streptomyces humi]|uniref:hypothetical protein n=1 Tax=Streptomyces humi TaxID=1428620 RepID=UPI0006288D23|nr:hypothetical protein [Streptomyces humi]